MNITPDEYAPAVARFLHHEGGLGFRCRICARRFGAPSLRDNRSGFQGFGYRGTRRGLSRAQERNHLRAHARTVAACFALLLGL
jgi:hypothetical protein